jgi:histone H3/H4
MKRSTSTLADAEQIVCAAVTAFGTGAKSMAVAPAAVESIRRKFMPTISTALEHRDWRKDWQREQVYVRAYAEALGERAKALAAEDKRRIILPADIDAATAKMRGYLPIAGRWCPV